MQLTEHLSYIIHSAKTIAYARDYQYVEPEHLMLALFYDENDLPKFILEKIKLNNPRLIRDFNENIPRKNGFSVRGRDIPLSNGAIKIIEDAEKEGLQRKDDIIGLEYLFLALFKSNNETMKTVFSAYGISMQELYEKMLNVVAKIETVDIVEGKAIKQKKADSEKKSSNAEDNSNEEKNYCIPIIK